MDSRTTLGAMSAGGRCCTLGCCCCCVVVAFLGGACGQIVLWRSASLFFHQRFQNSVGALDWICFVCVRVDTENDGPEAYLFVENELLQQ